MEKLVKISEAAKMLGVSVQTLRNWDKQGNIKLVLTPGKHRMFRLSDIEAFQKGEYGSEK